MNIINLSLASKIIQMPDGLLLAIIPHERLLSEDDKRRNLFKVDKVGVVQWQIGDYASMPSVSTFTNIELRDQEVWAFNFDGGMYRINPRDGAIVSSALVK
jgi:hypothetical protein